MATASGPTSAHARSDGEWTGSTVGQLCFAAAVSTMSCSSCVSYALQQLCELSTFFAAAVQLSMFFATAM